MMNIVFKYKKIFSICLLSSLAIASVGAAEKPLVVATTGMVVDAARSISGDSIDVRGLIGSGVDPHLYKATRSDIVLLNSAELVLYNGLLLEGRLSDAFMRLASNGKKVVAVTEEVDRDILLEPAEFQGNFDPHVWMDPVIWKEAIKVVAKEIELLNPAASEEYKNRLVAYLKQCDDLDAYAKKAFASLTPESRVLVTAHDAFNYFGRRYGLDVYGIQGISTESEAGVKDIRRIIDLLIERKVRAVFVESTVSKKNISALVEGAAARGHQVLIGGELFSDAMGKDGTYEGTYVGMLDHNITTIARALGADIPERGLYGKLKVKK